MTDDELTKKAIVELYLSESKRGVGSPLRVFDFPIQGLFEPLRGQK